ncbi:DUF3227 domain-containing protein [Actinotalea sp. K2]|uniref:DUF3227 domain-containing protein n=1 Tax=Actinotalea sp. K2 TaxID=2939438 RepID=UPI0020170F60|nr:DUF3227 domain-containing protein [Actinotalea sp. K2]MCL3862944.1 DUF3227 domain-containing protein [Actinotalea sp. K2]
MTFTIGPKAYNSLATPQIIDVELNDVDIDRMMTHLLELAVKQGRRGASRTDATEYDKYLDQLASNAQILGVQTAEGRAVLDGWVRASVLQFERGGVRRAYAQMGFVRTLTVASYRSGLPKTPGRNRRADVLAFRSMVHVLTDRGALNPRRHLHDLVLGTFGRNVDLGAFPYSEPKFDGSEPVDIDTLLALRFLEGFAPATKHTDVSPDGTAAFDPPVPSAVLPLGTDLVDFLNLFGPALPVAEAYAHMAGLVALRLFQLPLRSARTVRQLLKGEDPTLDPGLEIYCDFTRKRGSASDELAGACIQRDLEAMSGFFGDRLLLRSVGLAADVHPTLRKKEANAEGRLAAMAGARDDPMAQMALGMQLQTIRADMVERSDEDGLAFIEELSASDLDLGDQLKAVLIEGLRKRGLENQVKWFWSTGGVTKAYGLITGVLTSRTSWRYAPSDELLTTLLCMCFVEADGSRTTSRLTIRELLDRLDGRFGLLIDRPPAEFDTADARSGSSENLAAFTRHLQLLGCFEGLSDDFDAQFVTRPRESVR